ncbi:helix-turn-helix transcriptional regulator [Nanoarchaeota archaeon]
MRNISIKTGEKTNAIILTLLLIAVIVLAFISFDSRFVSSDNDLLAFAVQNHMWIMVVLVLISVAFGFYTSKFLYKEIRERAKTSQNILEVVMLFLGEEEKGIINFLVEKNGETTQAEISRLPGMTRVKAYRSLQKIQEKQLIDIIPHGKVRRIKLKENILNTLLEQNK